MFSDIKRKNLALFLRWLKEEKNIRGNSRFSDCIKHKRKPFVCYFFSENRQNESLFKIAQRSYLPWTLQDIFTKYYLFRMGSSDPYLEFEQYRAKRKYPKTYFNFGLNLSDITRIELTFVIMFLKLFGVVPRWCSPNPTNYVDNLRYATYLIINEYGEFYGAYNCNKETSNIITFCKWYIRALEKFLVQQLPLFKKMQYRFWQKFNKSKTLYETSICKIEKMPREQTPSY
jgi:hypothetical protein